MLFGVNGLLIILNRCCFSLYWHAILKWNKLFKINLTHTQKLTGTKRDIYIYIFWKKYFCLKIRCLNSYFIIFTTTPKMNLRFWQIKIILVIRSGINCSCLTRRVIPIYANPLIYKHKRIFLLWGQWCGCKAKRKSDYLNIITWLVSTTKKTLTDVQIK